MPVETKWTPGPWEWREHAEREETHHDIVGPLPIGLNPLLRRYVVADTMNRHHCVSPEEDHANAHLIAAAPELYEALEDMMGLVGVQISAGHYEECCARVKKAQSALAKARGEQ